MPTELIARLPSNSLGGAQIFRPCNIGGKWRKRGDPDLTAEELASLPRQSLRALQDQRFIVAYPAPADAPPAPETEGGPHVYNRHGTATYDVVLGRRLNTRPLSKLDAEALAARHQKPAAA